MNVAGGNDFWVVLGPVPGGPQGDNNWNPIWDNGATENRSQISTLGKFGTYSNFSGDLMLRLGGIFDSPYADISAGDLSNEVNGATTFNILAGQDVHFHQEFNNVGTQDFSNFVGELTIIGPNDTAVFLDEMTGGALIAGASTTLAPTTPFVPTVEGEYLAQCVAHVDDDVNALNDTTMLRFFVGGNHRWYRYDDEDPDLQMGFSIGNGWGLRFEPAEYPAAIPRIRVYLGGSGTGDFRIWENNSQGLPTGSPIWSSTQNVVVGWKGGNEIMVEPAR